MLSRKQYIKQYNELMKKLPYEENLPQVSDLLELYQGNETQKMQRIFKFFGEKAENELKAQLQPKKYLTEKDSKEFIDKVMVSNVTEIREAGSFFKQAMASAGDITIVDEDCNSNGEEIDIKFFDEADFDYYVKDVYFTITKNKNAKLYTTNDYEEFQRIVKNKSVIYIRTPFTCNHGLEHYCRTCVGKFPEKVINIGAFAALMVTEFNTQAQLSSMNKGVKETINSILSQPIEAHSKEEFIKKSMKIIDEMQGDVESRWYQIVLSSRWRHNKVYSMKSPSKDNLLGSFLYSANKATLQQIADEEVIADNSLKVQIMLNKYNTEG